MDKEYIKKLAENPDFIPGIYNYCDRWCERCQFTRRCMTFAMSREHFDDPESHDMDNKLFWDKLREVFQVTLEMVKESADELGIDLNEIDLEAEDEEYKAREETVKSHECCRAAKAYMEMVNDWLESAQGLFEKKADQLSLEMRLELPGSDPVAEAGLLKDSVNVVRWYYRQIYVKIRRALGGALDEFHEDANGSAKVALIGIDRSIAAWGQMRQYLTDHRDDILDILVRLDRLRRNTEATFPDARAFHRPGLDDVHQ